MQIKRFRAATTKEALQMVRKELGPEALVVETRKLEKGGFEVVAAIDREEGAPLRQAGARGGISADFLLDEMREIKELLVSMAGHGEEEGAAYRTLRREMINNGLDSGLVIRLLAGARSRGLAGGGERNGMARLRGAVRRELERFIHVKDLLSDSRIISFIGPTGAGKTTTMAKLAAEAMVKKKKKVALLTMDTLRIGAPDQVLKYGEMMGARVGVATRAGEARDFIQKEHDSSLILLDTPGMNLKKENSLSNLKALASEVPGLTFNLVLSLRERDDCLSESIRRVSGLPVGSITFTKLDEAASFGQMLNISARARRPISYLATGQRVPGDILRATVSGVLDYLMPA